MLEIYAKPGVARACLDLQDRLDLDVLLFLAVLYAAGRDCCLDAEAIRALDDGCEQWRTEVVRPLRTVRVRLKANPWIESMRPVAPFRASLKALELQAEKLQVLALSEAMSALPRKENRTDRQARIAAVAQLAVGHFAGSNLPERAEPALLVAEAVWLFSHEWP